MSEDIIHCIINDAKQFKQVMETKGVTTVYKRINIKFAHSNREHRESTTVLLTMQYCMNGGNY